jgi:hypothetical protein
MIFYNFPFLFFILHLKREGKGWLKDQEKKAPKCGHFLSSESVMGESGRIICPGHSLPSELSMEGAGGSSAQATFCDRNFLWERGIIGGLVGNVWREWGGWR